MSTGLTDDDAARLRGLLIEHGSMFGASNCRHCGVARCATWVEAYDTLAEAGTIMTEPERWAGPQPDRPR